MTKTVAKVSSVGRETLRSAASTRAGKSLKDYSVGWVLVGITLIIAFLGFGALVRAGQRSSQPETSLTVSTPAIMMPAPQAPAPQAADSGDTKWNVGAYDVNADARQRAEMRDRNTASQTFGGSQMPRSSGVSMNMPPLNTGRDMEAMRQEQQMRDMEVRNRQFQAQQEQQIRELQKQAEANQAVEWSCTRCTTKIIRVKSAGEPPREGTCIDLYRVVRPQGHLWTYHGPVR